MTFEPVALVPLTSACFFVGLLLLVGRRAPSARAFQLYLGWMVAWTVCSFLWRLGDEPGAGSALTTLLTFTGAGIWPVLLNFLQSQYPSRWAPYARVLAAAAVVLVLTGAVTGSFSRFLFDEGVELAGWEMVLNSAILVVMICTYVGSLAYAGALRQREHDPIERNRVTYIGAAIAVTGVGAASNLIDSLQMLPLDQAANGLAAATIAVALIRARLMNINVLARRALSLMVAGLAVGGTAFSLYRLTGQPLPEWVETGWGASALVLVAFVLSVLGYAVRRFTERCIDRIVLGSRLESRRMLLDFTRQMTGLLDLPDLSTHVTELCARALDSTYVAILLPDGKETHFRLEYVAGPFPVPQPQWTIRTDNRLLEPIVSLEGPVPPTRLKSILQSAEVTRGDIIEWAPYSDSVVAPIVSRGAPIGLLIVGPKVYGGSFSLDDMDVLTIVVRQAAVALENARLFESARHQAQTDFLTELPNHRYLQDLFGEALCAARRTGESVTVAMADVDNFKLLNDVHGHQAGDAALRHIANVLRASLRREDIVGRYGGDEFFFILPGLTAEEGEEELSRAADELEKTSLRMPELTTPIPVRISWGIASYPEDGATPRELVSAADTALLDRRTRSRQGTDLKSDDSMRRDLFERHPEKLRVAQGLLDIIDAKDAYTSEHSKHDASLSLLFADAMRLSDRQRYILWLGSLLHDVGKIGVPETILRKPGALTPDEVTTMRQHVYLGENIMRGLFEIEEVVELVTCHHERYDGDGYPRGRKGKDIPLLARMLIITDAFSAMTHDRPYRKGLTKEQAIEELRSHAGTQFDPELVEVFVRAIESHEVLAVA